MFFIQSKKKRFLELLAEKRAKNGPAQFHGIDLSHVDLSHADLAGIDLTGANLTNANLTGAKLVGTNLTKAKLIRTIFCHADLADVVLTDAVIDRATDLSLQQAANQQWIEAAQDAIEGFNQKWDKLKSVDGFNAFDSVLKRLLKNNVTMFEIVEVIDAVLNSPSICRLALQTAQSTDTNCYAHVLTTFNTIQGLTRFEQLLSDCAPQSAIVALAKGLVRQHTLDEATLPLMRHQWSQGRRASNSDKTGPNVGDALKVQLALRHQLAAQLKLPVAVRGSINAVEIAALTQSDREFAIDFVSKHVDTQDDMVDALVALPVWQLYLERVLGKRIIWAGLDEAQQVALEGVLRDETRKIVFE